MTKITQRFTSVHAILFFAVCCSFQISFAEKLPGLDQSPADISLFPKKGSEKVAKVIYSRPQAKGRKIFGDVVKYGKVWRTGANESTEITFFKDVKIKSQEIKKGTYSLFTIPEKGNWTIILNKDLNQWGAYSYNSKKDVTRVKIPSQKNQDSIDAFTIHFKSARGNKAHMVLAWDKTLVEVPIEY